jgi:hypothetical protein
MSRHLSPLYSSLPFNSVSSLLLLGVISITTRYHLYYSGSFLQELFLGLYYSSSTPFSFFFSFGSLRLGTYTAYPLHVSRRLFRSGLKGSAAVTETAVTCTLFVSAPKTSPG